MTTIVLDRANSRMARYMAWFCGVMLVFGLLLPNDWHQAFGLFALPIEWAARLSPGVAKLANASPIPNLVAGFLGFSQWAVVCFAFLLAVNDPLADRIRYAFGRPGKSPWKVGAFLYLGAVPAFVVCLWFAFVLPGEFPPSGFISWAHRSLLTMVSSRLGLALVGSIAAMGLGTTLFFLIVAIVGPLSLLANRR